MAKAKRAIGKGLQGLLAGATSGSPKVAAASAGINILGELFTDSPKFDPSPYRKGFKNYERGVRAGARRAANEAGANLGTALAARNLGGSALTQGLVTANRRVALQKGEDHINKARYDLETFLADREFFVDQQEAQLNKDAWSGVSKSAMQLLGHLDTKPSRLRTWLEKKGVLDPLETLQLPSGTTTKPSPAPAKPGTTSAPPTKSDLGNALSRVRVDDAGVDRDSYLGRFFMDEERSFDLPTLEPPTATFETPSGTEQMPMSLWSPDFMGEWLKNNGVDRNSSLGQMFMKAPEVGEALVQIVGMRELRELARRYWEEGGLPL